ncbi:cobyrinate a,c-diamide synthase [Aldersonia kunmingensis]|uniref:cobyrinate a,c-diamide synthase n=1 Tax=Aldersonia kunmingensis TaxID=408066 RepID=UPI000829D27E|nr:cobyrinate a,c-diamide synthase [Aldersonia kunmingensis]
MSVPAVVIAAPASGSGKTTVATGLVGALRAAGHRVAPFKVGPDYIDPGYHGLAAGRPGRNLDTVLVGAERVPGLYAHGSVGCDIAVVEGVMGLFDGKIAASDTDATPSAEGSTAQVAALLGAPVILVVDARGHSQSLAALLHGFATYDPAVRIGGVILNRVGSDRHAEVLRAACARVGLPVLGVLGRMDELSVPSRHLGLIPAVEHGVAAVSAVDAMTSLVAANVDLDAVVAAARSATAAPPWDPATEVGEFAATDGRVCVALAGGPAFTFGYAEHRELLDAAGADVAVFDPLIDPLPEKAAALVLPGGFPEEHAAELSANTGLRAAVAERVAAGMPVHAECAGLLYLTRTLDGHDMTGVLDVAAEFGRTLTLGYREAVALTDSSLWTAGERVTGHEFHRTQLVSGAATETSAWGWRSWAGAPVREGFVHGTVHASYLHTHPAGNPQAIGRFVRAAERFAKSYGR